jgi:uncharacterized YigZ family protein
MADPHFYNTIEREAFAEFRDRGSRFLGYAYPLLDRNKFKELLHLLKKEHPKASHHCYAYRIGWEGINFRASDDREPSGTAGRPILGQIDSRELTNLAVIVIRYFGGILLGVPGLIGAYKSTAALALQTVPVIRKPFEELYSVQFDPARMNEVMRIVKELNCRVTDQEIQLFCKLTLAIPKNREAEFQYKIDNLKNTEFTKLKEFLPENMIYRNLLLTTKSLPSEVYK